MKAAYIGLHIEVGPGAADKHAAGLTCVRDENRSNGPACGDAVMPEQMDTGAGRGAPFKELPP